VSRWTPCKRRDFVRSLRALGFDGPFSGTRHAFMVYGRHRLAIPSQQEYSLPQLRVMIGEVEAILGRKIPAEQWSAL